MSEKIIQGDGIISQGRVDRQEDLEPPSGINISHPSRDRRCYCCGRHISELKPFGGPDDPLAGDFTGALLIKMYRFHGPYDEEADRAKKEAESRYKEEGFEDEFGYLIHKYGPEKGRELCNRIQFYSGLRSTYECRDCVVLDEDEWFEKQDRGYGYGRWSPKFGQRAKL
jgi:hypothetical protein